MTMADASTTLESAGKAPTAEKSNMMTSTSAEKTNEKSLTGTENPAPTGPSNGVSKKPLSVDEARAEIATWVKNRKLLSTDETNTLNILLKEFDSQKEKVVKLKSLLGRSAKAQREAKVDLEGTQKRLEHALREIERLNKKIDKLANRPTHMELLADFETNFDRAMLSVAGHGHHQQTGGEDTGGTVATSAASVPGSLHTGGGGYMAAATMTPLLMDHESSSSSAVDHLLLQELNDSKHRIEKLESLNSALLSRSSQLEGEAKDRRRERDELSLKVSHLQLEKRMAVMEAEHATRAMQEKAASLAEMQLEIDLVTKASHQANVRASQGEELIKNVKTDKKHVQELEIKVQALQEWALASSEAKTLAQERVRLLEAQMRALQHHSSAATSDDSTQERLLWSGNGSLVVGAGDVGIRVVALDAEHIAQVKLSDRVILRWQFDLTTTDCTIEFNILKGACETKASQAKADYLIQNRMVNGGAAGDVENAFAIQNACTLLWSNQKSWVRPRTVKYTVHAIVVTDSD